MGLRPDVGNFLNSQAANGHFFGWRTFPSPVDESLTNYHMGCLKQIDASRDIFSRWPLSLTTASSSYRDALCGRQEGRQAADATRTVNDVIAL